MGSSPLPYMTLPLHLTSRYAGSSACRLIPVKTFFLSLVFLAAFLLLPGFNNLGWGQTQTFNTSGSFIVPTGVTSITVECWGGGGGGSNRGGAAGGGGGGAYTIGAFSGLTGGNSISITIGNGGAIGVAGNSSSAIYGTNTVTANGGLSVNNSRTGGTGGTATTIGGIIIASYAGGDGGDARGFTNGNSNEAGGGGGATDGNPDAITGSAPGGGGGGRGEGGGNSHAGADGQAIIYWTTVSATSTETCVGGNTGTITATGIGGHAPFTYSLDAGAFQGGATFSNLAAGSYTVNVKDNLDCTAFTTVTVNAPGASA